MNEKETLELARNILDHLLEQVPDEYTDDEYTLIYTWLLSADTSGRSMEQLAEQYDLDRF